MILLDWPSSGRGNSQADQVIAIFGLGLIGRSILASLSRTEKPQICELSFDWHDTARQRIQADRILGELTRLAEARKDRPCHIEFVWAAGRAGFSGIDADFANEQASFDLILDLADESRQRNSAAFHRFHLLSSGGGLFEGQLHVGTASLPHPRRPYGSAKAEQEQRVKLLHNDIATRIYRPSSVYGYAGKGNRAGLIFTLIHDAIHNRTSRIFGNTDTLRDYVFLDDVGAFVASEIVNREKGRTCNLLASGKPTSMIEVIANVEKILGRRLFLRYEAVRSNASNNTFRPSALPVGWTPTPLELGIYQTVSKIRNDFVLVTG